MSTDSTELTFVRCPACRSLVPAVSPRCRMCGATLDASAVPVEDATKKEASRVRQRTMSQPGSELSQAAGAVRQSMVAERPAAESPFMDDAPVVTAVPVATPTESDPDPLSAFIEEVPAEVSTPVAAVAAPAPIHTEEPPAQESTIRSGGVPAPVEEVQDEAWSAVEKSPPPPPSPAAEVIVERGRGAKGGLSFGPAKGEKVPEEPQRAPRPQPKVEAPLVKAAAPEQSKNFGEKLVDTLSERPAPAAPVQDRRPQNRPEEKRESRQDRREDSRVEKPRAPAAAVASKSAPEPEYGTMPGRLFGWLVNYSDPNGSAIELREGKFFVTRETLKPSDMLIDDASVSTPHAMLKISATQGFLVQDLMSENGVFVRPKGTDVYQQETEGCKLSHGDWVRFGNAEYLVSLIAHVGDQ